jgi:hypothetical protein
MTAENVIKRATSMFSRLDEHRSAPERSQDVSEGNILGLELPHFERRIKSSVRDYAQTLTDHAEVRTKR